jgi:hypothetical protein
VVGWVDEERMGGRVRDGERGWGRVGKGERGGCPAHPAHWR